MFDSGVMVVQLQSHSEEEMIASALDNVSFTVTNIILAMTCPGLTLIKQNVPYPRYISLKNI